VDFVSGCSISSNTYDLGIRKDSGVKPRRLFGLIVKPQTWGDLLNGWHGVSPSRI
jgi:hypothetical protein